MPKKPTLFSNIYELMTLEKVMAQEGRGPVTEESLSLKSKQSMIVEDGKVAWTGLKKNLPKQYFKAREVKVDGNIFPTFIECHTHTAFLGNRKNEFELRNTGVSYQEIAKRGGGIYSSVKATREGTVRELAKALSEKLHIFLQQGVSVVEVKTGYGLDTESELKLLEAIQKAKSDVLVVPTFLGAHAIPKDTTSKAYLESLKKILPHIQKKKLAKRVDIFIEKGYFGVEEAREYLMYAKSLGFDVCIHADQLTNSGGTLLAQELDAKSSDHSICVTDFEIHKVSKSNLTCVLLPSADFYIHSPYPPARKMIDAGVRVALSTDFNPGTSPSQSVQLVGVLARLKMNMSLPEVFAAWTVGASYALGLESSRGALVPGYSADFFVTDASWSDFFYDMIHPKILNVWIKGEQKV